MHGVGEGRQGAGWNRGDILGKWGRSVAGVNGMDGWMNQAYSRLSTTHGHITDCKLVCLA